MTPQVKEADPLLEEDGSGFITVDIDDVTRDSRSKFGLTVVVIAAAALLILAVVWATNTGNHQSPSTKSGAAATSGNSAGTVSAGAGSQSSVAGASAGAGIPAQSAAPSAAATATGLPNEVPTISTKVVKTGTLQLEVPSGSIPSAVGQLSSDAGGLGGFVASSTESSGGAASGDVTLRVPVANFNVLISDAQKLGKTIQLTSSGQDVTAQYVDLQARIDALQTTRTQFEQILAKAQSIGDILAVESQISDLQTQIEQLQGQFQVLDNQATYSTLSVQIDEAVKPVVVPPKPKVPSGVSKAWSHAVHSFAHGSESILAASGGVALFVVTAAIALVIGWLVWTGFRRRSNQPAATDRA